jgi:hypothetical protein
VFAEWDDEAVRSEWLHTAGLTVRKATPAKSMRITWADGTSTLDVSFNSRGNGRTRLVVDHRRLATAAEVARMKALWSEALDALEKIVEG